MTTQAVAASVVAGTTGFARRGRWVPWALFGVELVGTAIIIGILSIVFVVQLTFNPFEVLAAFNLFAIAAFGAIKGLVSLFLAVLVFVITGTIVGVLGLPVRFVPAIRRFWLGNGEVTVFGGLLGGILLVIAYFPLGGWVELDSGAPAYQPDPAAFLAGWILLAFCLSLFVWPARWLPARARAWWTETQLTPPARAAR
jgi:hypothetical protein